MIKLRNFEILANYITYKHSYTKTLWTQVLMCYAHEPMLVTLYVRRADVVFVRLSDEY